MTGAEWDQVVAVIAANWPGNPPPDESIDKWFHDLKDLDGTQVLTAVEALYRDGREFPPNGAQIRAKVIDLSSDDLDWSEAWELVRQAARKFGLGARWTEALAWTEERSLLAAIAAKRMGLTSVFRYDFADGEATVRAQYRDIYRQVLGSKRTGQLYAGLPSAGLHRLGGGERTSEVSPPSQGTIAREDRKVFHHPRKAGVAVRALAEHIAPEGSKAA